MALPACSEIHKLGLFTYKNLEPDEIIFEVKPYEFLDAGVDLFTFVNHSCKPNCCFVGIAQGVFAIRTLQKISRDAELTIDYNTLRNLPLVSWNFLCNCGSENCQGQITGGLDVATKKSV